MALKACWECGEEVSDSARKCPKCGADYPANGAAAKIQTTGASCQAIGCVLTLLITVPILLAVCFLA